MYTLVDCIKMGVSTYQKEKQVKEHNIAIFSSNYTLSGDISGRVMHILQSFVPEMEIYSIEEAFLNLTGMNHFNLKEFATKITDTAYRSTGTPVSMGIAPTKTLAKIANKFTKKHAAYRNVCLLNDEEKSCKALKLTEISDVWGDRQAACQVLKE